MDQLPPYEFHKYVFATRCAVAACSSFELLMLLSGSLEDSNALAKLIYFLFLAASAAISAHNIALNCDGREEIKRAISSTEPEVRGKSVALVLGPVVAGVWLFLGVSGHALFSLFVLIHVLAAVGQLGMEVYENFAKCPAGSCSKNTQPRAMPTQSPDPLASPIVAPKDRETRAATFDPNYQTLNNIHNEIFDKK